ncbi:MAG: ATP-binding cassette domain-containing protein [Legionellales bacterium]|nr:ATP-binding cassette domain-containing protein [Legionellales bacterium]
MPKYMVAVLGPNGSGKSQLVKRLLGKFPYNESQKIVIDQVGMKQYEVEQQNIEVQYWDFPPLDPKKEQQNQLERTNSTLVKMHKICITFDVTDPNWQEKLDTYIRESGVVFPGKLRIDTRRELAVPVILVGTKVDLLREEGAQAALEVQAKAYAKKTWGTEDYSAVSAKTDFRLNELVQLIITDLPSLEDVAQDIDLGERTTRRNSVRRGSISRLTARLQNGESPGAVNDRLVNDRSPDRSRLRDLRSVARNLSDLSPSSLPSRIGSNAKDTLIATLIANRPTSTTVKATAEPLQDLARESEPNGTYLSSALRLAGMAVMFAALTSLIYLALVAASLISAVTLTAAVNSVVVTVGGLLGIAAPEVAFAAACAAMGISATVGATLLAATASFVAMGMGYGLSRLGQPPVAPVAGEAVLAHPVQQPAGSAFSFALRMVGFALMVAAVVNLVYLALIAANVLSAVALTTAMSHVLATAGGVLGVTAPAVAFGNACAAWGISTSAATTVIAAASSMLVGLAGYGVFRCGKPATEESVNTHTNRA